jgi:FMN phosphatase YigB (HAD superfamily)
VLAADPIVFLLDIDNTLFDNDRFAADLGAQLEQSFGPNERDRYWGIFTTLRQQLGYADYLTAVQILRAGLEDSPRLLQLSAFLLEYPFSERLFPQALDVIDHLNRLGNSVVLSDGDVIFQPRKVWRTGIWDAVAGRVMIYVHKELMLESVQRLYPASHYVLIDDKPTILATMKRMLGQRLSTVFVRQGHYAHDADMTIIEPKPDMSIDRIAALLDYDRSKFITAAC